MVFMFDKRRGLDYSQPLHHIIPSLAGDADGGAVFHADVSAVGFDEAFYFIQVD